MIIFSENNENLSCIECKATFSKPFQLARHRRKHKSTHPYYCRHCTQRFKTKSLLEKHAKSCQNEKRRRTAIKNYNESEEEEDVPLSALKKNETVKNEKEDGEARYG